MSSAAELARQAGKSRSSGNGYMCKCPCHDDSTSSLWIVDKDGDVHVECKAGCDFKDVRKALGIEKKIPAANNGATHPLTTYNYTDANGKLIFQKVRKPNKSFSIRRPDGAGGFVFNMEGIKDRPLYNLPAVLAAINAGNPIAILEGEKDCNNFQKLTRIPATCNFDGASASGQKPKWKAEYSAALKGAQVFLLYDNDEAGRTHRDTIIASLMPFAKSITVCHLPDVFNGKPVKDFSDFFNAGGSEEEFYKLRFEVFKAQDAPGETTVNAAEWLLLPEVPSNPILSGLFDKGDKVVITGKSKTRKSFFALQMAFTLASARSFLGFPALESISVLIVQFEVQKWRYHARCKRMADRLGIEASELRSINIFNARGVPNLQAALQEQVKTHRADLVIIDPFYKLIDGDENKAEDIKPILKVFDTLAEETGAAIVYIHHDKKGAAGDLDLTDRGSGSGILARDFDAAIFLTMHESEDETLVVEFIARNYAAPEPLSVQWMNYGFSVSDAEAKKLTSRSPAKKAKLPALVERARKAVAEKYLSGVREIPMSVFNAAITDLGISKHSLPAIKDELLGAGVIEIETNKATKGGSAKKVILKEITTEKMPIMNFNDENDEPPF